MYILNIKGYDAIPSPLIKAYYYIYIFTLESESAGEVRGVPPSRRTALSADDRFEPVKYCH